VRPKKGKGRMDNITQASLHLPSDEEITSLFFAKTESAISETERKYGRLFLSISAGILGNAEDAVECVNDTYLKLWNSIPPERPKNLKAYGAKIVRNLSINRAEYNSAERRGGGEVLEELSESIPDGLFDPFDEGEISRSIDTFLRRQDRESRVIFVLRYWYCTPLEQISKKLGLSVPNVKSRLFRTRKKLKSYLEKEGISL